ncbi:hypothetical protein DFS34DRAFT_148869 [Phlyctochytrium arcticum]|nr:hypothetical protein DFS34DRAFT_148869 [Phlyctochytrium arcticum]
MPTEPSLHMTLIKSEAGASKPLSVLSLGQDGDMHKASRSPSPKLPKQQLQTERPVLSLRAARLASSTDNAYTYNSAAINTIKANQLARDRDAQQYMRRFTTSPSAPLSASSKHPRPQTGREGLRRTGNGSSRRWSMGMEGTPDEESYPIRNSALRTRTVSHHTSGGTPFVRLNGTDVRSSSTLPKPPELPSHCPPHSSTHPIGAHTAGFYAKQAYAQAKTSSLPLTGGLPPNFRHIASPRRKRAHTADGIIKIRETDMGGWTGKSHKGKPAIQMEDSYVVELFADDTYVARTKRPSTSADLQHVEEYLGILTDVDCVHEQLLEALNCLLALAEESEVVARDVLYDKGAIPILLNLIRQSPSDMLDVSIKACALLQMMAAESALARPTITEYGGVDILLETVTSLGRVVSDNRRFKYADRANGRGKSKNLMAPSTPTTPQSPHGGYRSPENTSTGTLLSHTSLPMSEEAGRSNGANLHLLAGSDTPGPQESNGIEEEETSLIAGLLQKYFQPQFLAHVEKTDKTTRSQIIRHLLVLFEKVDKLLSVSSAISLDVDLDTAMRQIIYDGTTMLQAEMLLLFLVDRNGDLVPLEFDMSSSNLLSDVHYPLGSGIAGYVAQSECIVNIRDAMNNERFDVAIDIRNADIPAHSILSVPIRTRDNVLKGVLQAVNKYNVNGNPMYFNHEDEFLMKALARTAAIIIKNGQVYETMMKTQKKVEVLLETTRSLGSTLELDHLIKMIMDSAKELLSADRCTLFLRDTEGKYLRAHVQGRDSLQEIRIPLNAGIAGFVYTSGESVNIPDAYKDPRFNPDVDKQTGYVTKNILCMPIRNISGESIGVTQMINKQGGAFTMDDERILSSFSAQAAVAIEKSQLFKKTEDMRAYLQSILSSITSCVITLSDSMKLNTINRPWFVNALGVTEEYVADAPVSKWINEKENPHLLNDILSVYQQGTPVYSAEYELKGPKGSTFINYQIMPLLGEAKGVVMVLDDISAEKRAVMTLGRYMSPALAKQVMEEDGSQLGGKRKKVTILFSDIRSFTTIAESMEPHEVVELLNHHFSDAVNAIMSEQGILDKYIGDAVMAVFGVPFVSAEDGTHACNAALRMRDCLILLNESRAAAGKREIKIGIGLNTGMVLSGNIGSIKRMEFSCIGDAVNLASRTEGLTKSYNVQILVTENTLQETNDSFLTRYVDSVVVTGKTNKVDIFELLGRKDDVLSDNVLEGLELYKTGLQQYRERQFEIAAATFSKAMEVADDGPSKTLLARCKMYIAHPPPDDLNLNVHIAEGK